MSDTGDGITDTKETASQSEGKKRRSFLPAPKKSSGVSPTSPQPPSNVPVPQQQQQSLSSSFSSTTTSSLGKAPSSTSSSYGDREPPKLAPEKPQQADVTKAEKPTEELAFGIGLRVGARVKIGGVKPGILRYLGTTHLAPGIFCGIELFDPEGKHDGEVGGHRYFNCAPKYGIFAPKEKVCLDTSQPLGRLSSDSDNCYSSTESLSERTQKAFRTFSEGELEAIDCTKLSPILSPEDGEARYSDTKARHIKGSRLPGKGRLASAYELVDPASISDSLDQQEVLSEIPTKKQKSGLPRARSSLPTPASSQSRLPSYSSRAYGDGIPTYKLSSTYSSQTAEALPTKTICRPPQAGSSVDPNPENDKYPGGSARSSEDSEEDGGTRDTLSTGIKKQLRADSRQYLNFTFDPEELSHSQDSDNDLDTKGKQQNATNPLYSDPRFMRDISGDSSDESLGVLSPRVISSNSLCASENFMRVESGTLLCQDIPCVTSTPTPGRPRDSGAVKSDSYTIESSSARQDLDMSISSAGTEGDTSALSATRSISDSDLPPELLPSVGDGRDGGLSATFLTSDVQRLSEGYVPDTDSELGTLTTTSPNTDWVDRLGVTHPTSYAPLDQADGIAGLDIGYNIQKQTAQCQSVTTPTAAAPQLQTTKPSDDEDYNSDLPTTAEDDRIEADQVYQPPAISTPSGTLSPGHEEGSPVDPGETTITPDQSGQLADPNSSIDSTVSVQKEGEDENKEGKGSNKEDSGQQRKSRPKKPLTITKKRSENIDHKLPNTSKVRSTLADYIKAPPPVKPKEEKEKEQKEKELKKKMSKNAKNAIQKRMSVTELSKSRTKIDTSRASSVDRANIKRDTSSDRNRVEKPPEKPKPIIKRTPPKSKWGNIMSQIESSKDNVKPKPKSEIKSSLAAYLNAPPPAPSPATTGEDSNNITVNMVKTDQPNTKRSKRESRIKPLPPPPPKIDLSKVKSKLNVPTAASANKTIVKRETSPSGSRTRNVSKTSRESSPAAPAVSAATKENVAPAQRKSEGNIVLVRQPLEDGVSSVRSSRTDLSVCDSVDSAAESRADEEATPSKRGSVDFTKKDRRLSTNSLKSEPADKSRSRREQNKATYTKRTHTIEVKSTIPPFTPIKIPSRAIEIRIGDGSNVSSQRSSPTPIIVKPVKPKPKTNAKTVTSAKPAWGAGKPTPSPTAASVKGRDSGSNQARKPRVNGTAKSVIASTNNARSSSSTTSTTSAAQKEIVRLESLCEARTKELTHTKMQLKATTQGFDAMAVLVNYCCAELNAFECPTLAKKLEVVQKQLTDCLSQIADLSAQKESLDQNLTQVTQEKDEATKRAEEALSAAEKQKEEHAKLTHELDDTHNAALTTQRDELTSKHAEEQNKIRQYYDKQIDLIKHAHDRQMSDLKNEHKLEINGMKISHLEEIQELRNKHDDQMEELHKQHRNKLEDITHRFESIKLTLSEKVESLRGECDEMTRRARCSEEALQRDADVKVQIALAPYLNLPKEIESLKTVVEMRNEEIQKLRSKNMDLEKQLEELPIAKEKIISLQQKVENLEAIINIKTDHEKQLHEKCQVLMRKYDRESRANKRLSMDYEQVMWRMSQSSEFGSCESLTKRHFSRSPPRSEASSPDPRRRNLSPNDAANGEVVMRVKKRNSHSLSEDDRKLRSRSATFVVEKENSESRSPSSSPQLKQKRWRKKSQTEELAAQDQAERMCHSAGAELMSEIASQQHKVVEQLKSEMTDSQDSSSSCVAMASSYARSLSGVSDSGVYDSMTRSELNSSMVSTDSEFGTSVNLSMNLDSTMDEYESGPQAGDYNSITDTTVIPGKGSSSTSDSGNVNCGSVSGDSVTNGVSTASSDNNTSTDHGDSKNCSNYEFQVSLPDGTTDDNVFDDSYSLDSPNTTSDSITFVEANVSDSKLTSATAATENVDTAVSSPHTVTDVQDTSSPQDSSTKSS